jgi:SPP1 gp7 family putative phage head morphogenesis protein
VKFDLARLVKRRSRQSIDLARIITTKAQADDLAKIYLRVVNAWKAGTDSIIASYERTLSEIVADSVESTGGAIDDIAAALQRLVLQLTPALRDWAFRVEQWHRGKWTRGVLAATDIDLSLLLGPQDVQETVEATVARNVALVRDVSDEAKRRIADSVFRGLQQRTPAVEVAKEIREATGMARARSIRIAADQSVKLASALDAERQRQAGLDHWKWRWSHKKHGRPEHIARDGKIYTDETAPKDLPGVLPFCGCVRQGVIVFDDD